MIKRNTNILYFSRLESNQNEEEEEETTEKILYSTKNWNTNWNRVSQSLFADQNI